MANSMYYINTTMPRTECYVGESTEDLAKMPTMTTVGQAPYKKALAPFGSLAKIYTNSGIRYFTLKSTGWLEVTDQMSGGGGGGEIPPGSEIATDDEFNDLLDNLFP